MTKLYVIDEITLFDGTVPSVSGKGSKNINTVPGKHWWLKAAKQKEDTWYGIYQKSYN